MNNENMNDVAMMVTEVENAVSEPIQETIENVVNSNHSNLAGFAVGAGTAVGGYLIGKYVVEPVVKKVKTGISNWWHSLKKSGKDAEAEAEATDENYGIDITEDIKVTHKIG